MSICWSVMLGLPDMFKTFGIAAASAIMVCATRFRGDVRLMGGVGWSRRGDERWQMF